MKKRILLGSFFVTVGVLTWLAVQGDHDQEDGNVPSDSSALTVDAPRTEVPPEYGSADVEPMANVPGSVFKPLVVARMLEQQAGRDLRFSPDQVERIADDYLKSTAPKKQ